MKTFSYTPLAFSLVVSFQGVVFPVMATPGAPQIPAGFEELILGQNEQVEVLFLGETLGLFSALVKPDTLEFTQPEKLVKHLQERHQIKAQYVQSLQQSLSLPLARNGHRKCTNTSSSNGCGYVESDSAAVIFDENRNAIDLFINKEWIIAHNIKARYYALSKQSQNAFIHSQSLTWATSREYSNASLSGLGALGLGERRYLSGSWDGIWSKSTNTSKPQVNLQDFYLRQDFAASHYMQAGLLDQRNLASSLGGNFNFSLLPMPQFVGFRVGTTQAYVNQTVASQQDEATPITVILNREARVDIYYGERLLATQYFPAGMQNIKSDGFPNGSYPLTLRIYENGVLSRSETIPFSKTGSELGGSNTEWFLQGGRIGHRYTNSDNKQKQSWQTGVRARVLRSMVLTSGFAGINNQLFSETRADWQASIGSNTLMLASSWLIGQNNVRGSSQQMTYSNGVSWNLYRYQQRGSHCQKRKSRDDNLGCYNSLTASASTAIAGWTGLLGYTRSKSHSSGGDIGETPDTYLPAPSRSQRNSRKSSLQFSLARSFTLNNLSVSGRLGVYHANSDNQKNDKGGFIGVSISHIRRPPSSPTRNSQTSAGMEYRTSPQGGIQNSWYARHSESSQETLYREADVSLYGDSSSNYGVAVGGRTEGRFGNLTATYSHNQSRQSVQNQSLTGIWSSSVITNGNDVWLGGRGNGGNPPAASLVSVVGKNEELPGAAVDVYYMGRPLTLGLGQSAVILTDGYQSIESDVRESVMNKNSLFAQLGNSGGLRKEFVTPGHLMTREVAAKVTWTWVGRAMFAGTPLSHGDIINLPREKLDKQGAFMLETHTPMKTLYVSFNQAFFACPLKVRDTRDVLRIIGETECKTIPLSALPDQYKAARQVAMREQQSVPEKI